MSKEKNFQAFLREKEVATRLGVSTKWLQKMRYVGGGIPYHKFGGAIRYAVRDIETFEVSCRMENSSEPLPLYTPSDLSRWEKGRDCGPKEALRGDS